MNTMVPWKKRNPWQEMEALQTRMGRLFGSSMPTFGFEGETSSWPAVDLEEMDGEYRLVAELPGMTLEDVEVDVEDGFLTLKGENETEREEAEGRWHIVERTHGSFERSFAVPRSVDPMKISAELKDGLLTVRMPKNGESRGRRIEVREK